VIVSLDTNIFLSALISPKGIPALLYEAWRDDRFVLATCRYQMQELRDASKNPKFRRTLRRDQVGRMMNTLNRALIIHPLPGVHTAADPTDAFLLDLAVAAAADYLVTGDKQAGLLQLGKIKKTRIVTAAQFCHDVLKL